MNPMLIVASTPGRRRAAGGRLLVALAAVAALVSIAASTALAQVAQGWSNDTPLDPYEYWRGARVQAMGDLTVAVDDDRNPFNPYGYSGNVAGLVTARDTSWAEQNSSYRDYFDTYWNKSHSVVQKTTGIRFGWLASEKWAVAGEVDYGNMHASRHDQGTPQDYYRFIRDFDISLPDYFIPRTADRTIGAGVIYPTMSVTYARKFFPWFTLGGKLGYRSEKEDRTVLHDPYDFDNTSSATEITGGLLLHPSFFKDRVRVGFFGTYLHNNLKGVSSSPLNEDSYDTERPLGLVGGQVEYQHGWLHGIVEARHHEYDGEQIAMVNWAPQFFLNPMPSEVDQTFVFKKKWSTGVVGVDHDEFRTRWSADVPNTPLHVGVRYAYYEEFQWSRLVPDVLSPLIPIDVRRLGYDAAGGLSFALPDQKATIAAEVQMSREDRADWTQVTDPTAAPSVVPNVNIGNVSYHFGAEYKGLTWLPLRAGIALRRYDPNRNDGVAPYRGTRLTAGASHRWNALKLLIDAAWSHERFVAVPGDPSLENGRAEKATLSFQYLF